MLVVLRKGRCSNNHLIVFSKRSLLLFLAANFEFLILYVSSGDFSAYGPSRLNELARLRVKLRSLCKYESSVREDLSAEVKY